MIASRVFLYHDEGIRTTVRTIQQEPSVPPEMTFEEFFNSTETGSVRRHVSCDREPLRSRRSPQEAFLKMWERVERVSELGVCRKRICSRSQ